MGKKALKLTRLERTAVEWFLEGKSIEWVMDWENITRMTVDRALRKALKGAK